MVPVLLTLTMMALVTVNPSSSERKPSADPCRTPADCSYNGVCTSAAVDPLRGASGVAPSCKCKPQWKGAMCDVFNFAAVVPSRGVGLRSLNATTGGQVSSWGGSVLVGDDGVFHMYAAEMAYGVGIKSWRSNSRVVHATADPRGGAPFAFKRQGIAQPVFAHEPTVARAPTGEYVMMFTTNYGEVPGGQCGPPCHCGHNGTSCLSCPNAQQCPAKPAAPLSTRMSYATKPEGPWSTPALVPSRGGGDTNLACIVLKNSSLVCLGRPSLGILTATHWKNVSSYSWHHVAYGHGEDPMLWSESASEGTAEVLHAVTHGGGWGDPFGYHYWSTDGGWSWTGTGKKAYGNIVEVEGQTTKVVSRRERPHVVQDAQGTLVGLTTAVTEAWPCTTSCGHVPDNPPCKDFNPFGGTNPNPKCGPGSNGTILWCPIDYCYTLFQPFVQEQTGAP